MKTWEMMKELTESPDKTFKRADGLTVHANYGKLSWESGFRHLGLNDEWEEAEVSVTFIEAVASGKQIKVKHDYLKDVFRIEDLDSFNMYMELNILLEYLVGIFKPRELAEIILNGKWYVE